MKILVAGDWHSELHEQAVYNAFIELGHETLRFAWYEYFKPVGIFRKLTMPFFKAQNKYMFGPLVDRLNRELVDLVAHEQPDLVFVYRGTHIYKETLQLINKIAPRAVLAGYNNDDPFSPHYPKWKWRHFLAGVPEYDLVFAYRLHNIEEFKSAGAKKVKLLRSWFIPEWNKPINLTDLDRQRFGCDVAFIGHYENDGRLEYCESLLIANINLKIHGPYKGFKQQGWYGHISENSLIMRQTPLTWLGGEDYVKAICAAKIGLCFLSKLNRDTYTRRCFEIPACGTALFAEYSEDLSSIYREGHDVEYFRSQGELIEKVKYYLSNPEKLNELTLNGQRRVHQDGHDVVSRMREMIGQI
ncbi:MAG: glycosyltransferase [Candidatus Brocadiales bacterium]|nr:glycosyltransferase [Candidatus Brocadiales bacterium]